MSWIPGWDTIGEAGWWSGFFFWASIVSLIGLGITEVASHRYSERKDELAEIEQREIQRHHDDDMARVQHDTAQANERAAQLEKDNIQLNIRLEEERKNRISLQKALATPHLTPEQIDQLAQAVRGRVTRLSMQYTSDASSLALAQDIKTAFERAGVPIDASFTGIISPKPYGLFVRIPGEEFRFLTKLFQDFDLAPKVTLGPDLPIAILVGEKMPPF